MKTLEDYQRELAKISWELRLALRDKEVERERFYEADNKVNRLEAELEKVKDDHCQIEARLISEQEKSRAMKERFVSCLRRGFDIAKQNSILSAHPLLHYVEINFTPALRLLEEAIAKIGSE